ncbi:MAG: TcpQ domain-containing protein [Lysobacteraceae bacterium]|jgi:hypothetical protein|nr:toxin co-regulated pilus biosynthesis Q family protein [Xanthomonadaceae bacterium]MCZ8317933.1 TcpQ domain-containing protein [Silanimonas sp.]
MSFRSLVRPTAGLAVLILVTACGTNPAKDFRGRWRPVNTPAAAPVAMPLEVAPTFSVTPADRSLRRVLDRWASSVGRRLDWRAPADFTLHADATRVHASRLDVAVAALERAYAEQGLQVELPEGRVRVSIAEASGR